EPDDRPASASDLIRAAASALAGTAGRSPQETVISGTQADGAQRTHVAGIPAPETVASAVPSPAGAPGVLTKASAPAAGTVAAPAAPTRAAAPAQTAPGQEQKRTRAGGIPVAIPLLLAALAIAA